MQKFTPCCHSRCGKEVRHSYKKQFPFWNHIQAVQFVIIHQNRFTAASLWWGLCTASESWDWCSGKETLEVDLNSNSASHLVVDCFMGWIVQLKPKFCLLYIQLWEQALATLVQVFSARDGLQRLQTKMNCLQSVLSVLQLDYKSKWKDNLIKFFCCHFQQNSIPFLRF